MNVEPFIYDPFTGEVPKNPLPAAPRCHDDGPLSSLYLGGVGGPNFSRDLAGNFRFWHILPGYHIEENIPQAGFWLHLSQPGSDGRRETLSLHERDFPTGNPHRRRRVEILFPFLREIYLLEDWGIQAELEFFSPALSSSPQDRSQPTTFMDLKISGLPGHPQEDQEVSLLFVWPHLAGWRQDRRTVCHRGGRIWPGQFSQGNTARQLLPAEASKLSADTAVIQDREASFGGTPDTNRDEGEGQTVLTLSGGRETQAVPCLRSELNSVPRPPEDQPFTFPGALARFQKEGRLPEPAPPWRAQPDEAMVSALCSSSRLPDREALTFSLSLTFDFPVVRFGSGRPWLRRSAAFLSRPGWSGREAAAHALDKKDQLRRENRRAQKELAAGAEKEPLAGGALINELGFLTSGGSCWTWKTADAPTSQRADHQKPDAPTSQRADPRLGAGEHFAFLEGYDIGYYYYSTADLWFYAYPALTAAAPELGDLIFEDYVRSVKLTMPEERMIFRTETLAPRLAAGKIPHDIGSVMGDPWHDLNGYSLRDDPNLWIDHNPAFILSLYLHRRLTGRPLSRAEIEALQQAGTFMLNQTPGALPRHQAFGDNTWDALQMKGAGTYSALLYLGALEVLERLFPEDAATMKKRRQQGLDELNETLWRGDFFRTSEGGQYHDSVMADSLLGAFYAEKAGLPPLISADRGRRHMEKVYHLNYREKGVGGPLLVAALDKRNLQADGAEELQAAEVIVGSAWAAAAMMDHWGLKKEASEVRESLAHQIYKKAGLQFRTPAAWDAHQFRAPLNMRPLAGWLSLIPPLPGDPSLPGIDEGFLHRGNPSQ